MTPSTLHDERSPAVICREKGWRVGTVLVGNEGYGPHAIRITAVGEDAILARCVSPCTGERERTWVLNCRDWQEAGRD